MPTRPSSSSQGLMSLGMGLTFLSAREVEVELKLVVARSVSSAPLIGPAGQDVIVPP
jgi:hypothetical protein